LSTRAQSAPAAYDAGVLVVNRFRDDGLSLRDELRASLAVLLAQPGCEDGRIGRNVDEPSLWVMVTRWRDVGSYRRALSSYDVKVTAVPLLSQALDEPSAYEVVGAEDEPLAGSAASEPAVRRESAAARRESRRDGVETR